MSKLLVEMITTRVIEEGELDRYCAKMAGYGLRLDLLERFRKTGEAVLETPMEGSRTVYRWTRMA